MASAPAWWPRQDATSLEMVNVDHLLPPLPPWARANGTEHFGSESGLRCFLDRMLRRRKPVTVAALGGSISAGSSYTVRQTDDLYHSRVAAALQRLGPPGANLSITDHNGVRRHTPPPQSDALTMTAVVRS